MGLIGIVGAVLGLVIGLHQLGSAPGLVVDWGDPTAWLRTSSPEVVVAAILRQAGLLLGYWVLVSTAAYAVARVGDHSILWVRFLTLPFTRRLVDRAIATSLAVSVLGSPLVPAAATEHPAVFEASGDGIPVPHVRVVGPPPAGPASTPPPTVADNTPSPKPLLDVAKPATQDETTIAPEATHVVMEGDNMWTIAADYLTSSVGSSVDSSRIAAYWRVVIEHNRSTLRSGDPNLIYPGELIILPSPGAPS